jgi:hypothetical protein
VITSIGQRVYFYCSICGNNHKTLGARAKTECIQKQELLAILLSMKRRTADAPLELF